MFELGFVSIAFMRALFVVGLLASTACTEKNPLFCAADSECTTGRICDVTGEFEGTSNVCIPAPDDCPIERCGCEPGESFSCDGDQLTRCAEDGKSTVISTCALGCSTESRCLAFEPSNGLGAALTLAENEPDLVLPAGTTIDTSTGTIQDAEGVLIPVTSVVIDQDGGSSIRAFLARNWILDDLKVTGSRAFAIVAFDSISIRGVVDASAEALQSGPGGQESPAVCVGNETVEETVGCGALGCPVVGAGGGGNATAGATGGGLTLVNVGRAGGAPIPTFVPLVGGCRGGNFSGTLPRVGGAGGGAVQLVANSRVEISGGGIIDVGGGGGDSFAGGGSGGNIVIEAPTMIFDGSSTGVFANGGAGGGCSLSGEDATRTLFRALAPKCSPSSAGDGGTESSPPQPGQTKCTSGTCSFINEHQGGGGGSAGRLLIRTGTGDFSANGAPTLSVAISKATLVVN
jgi:hypothetical protein